MNPVKLTPYLKGQGKRKVKRLRYRGIENFVTSDIHHVQPTIQVWIKNLHRPGFSGTERFPSVPQAAGQRENHLSLCPLRLCGEIERTDNGS